MCIHYVCYKNRISGKSRWGKYKKRKIEPELQINEGMAIQKPVDKKSTIINHKLFGIGYYIGKENSHPPPVDLMA